MTAAKVMDIISRLPGCSAQAGDAVSAYNPVSWKNKKFLEKLFSQNCKPMKTDRGNLLQECDQRFERLSEDQLSRLCSEAGLRLAEVGQFFYTLPSPREEANQSSC